MIAEAGCRKEAVLILQSPNQQLIPLTLHHVQRYYPTLYSTCTDYNMNRMKYIFGLFLNDESYVLQVLVLQYPGLPADLV